MPTDDELYALIKAAEEHNLSTLEKLVADGVDVNSDWRGNTALIKAVARRG
jgi:hypothetical protein